jgi:hypothetical protein
MGLGCAPQQPRPASQEEPLEVSVGKMMEFMATMPPDPEVATAPIPEMQTFTARIIASGSFQNLNYMTSGGASIQEKNGEFFLVFDADFDTPNGPDLQIYLTKNAGPTDRTDIPGGIALGKLKSIQGKQVYPLPDGITIADYHSVTIHCKAFNVPWSFAPIK